MSETPKYLLSTLALTDEQRTALEQELLPLARSAALGALTADIAHDLANPLFAVLGHVDLLLLDAEPGSPLEQRLRLVRQTALELKDGLRTLLDFARPPEGVASAALDDAARVATALIRHGYAKELQIAATYPAGPVVVDCPPGDLAQAGDVAFFGTELSRDLGKNDTVVFALSRSEVQSGQTARYIRPAEPLAGCSPRLCRHCC